MSVFTAYFNAENFLQFGRRHSTGNRFYFWSVFSAIFSGVLLAVPFLVDSAYLLSWFAFVPILVAMEKLHLSKYKFIKVYCLGLLFGLASYICAVYWVADFLVLFKNYLGLQGFLISLAFWVYCAQLPALMFVAFFFLKSRASIHEFVLFPLLVITFYSAFPIMLSAQVGESQSQFSAAIQATEFVGVQGLDGVLALSNIFLAHIVLGKMKKTPVFFAVALLSLWFSYGFYSSNLWGNKISSWDTMRVGIVQPNDAPSIRENNFYNGYSLAFPPEMEMTQRLADAKAELVVWPESRYKNYLDSDNVKKAFLKTLSDAGTSLIFQDIENIYESDGSALKEKYDKGRGQKSTRYNSVVAIDSKGNQLKPYRKNLLMIFGEYMPEFKKFPFISDWFHGVLGDFNSGISAGTEYQYFDIGGKTFIPLICYETLFPRYVAKAVAGKGRGGILIGLSNDSWFGKSAQTYQHLNASKLRAVENRLPFILALNGGLSSIIMPNGEVVFQSDAFQTGAYLVEMPYSKNSGGSFFSRHPNLFLFSVYSFLGLVIFLSAFKNLFYTARPSKR